MSAAAHYRVEHVTRYRYAAEVSQSQQLLHLCPRATDYQQVSDYHLDCDPLPHELSQRLDFFGNPQHHLTLLRPHEGLQLSSRFTVAVQPRPALDPLASAVPWEHVQARLQQGPPALLEAMPFVTITPRVHAGAALTDLARSCFTPQRPLLEAALALTHTIYQTFEFDAQATEVSTPLEAVLAGRRGVCQDFAHVMIGALRALGLAARYVSGYLLTHPPAGQPRLVGADASHAWVSVYCPEAGWVDFDPTNNCLVQQDHITVAWGRDFGDVSPVRGVVLGGGQQQLAVNVTVTPL